MLGREVTPRNVVRCNFLCTNVCTSGPDRTFSPMSEARHRRSAAITRIADRIDLAIDLLTLGQYGLERVPVGAAGGEECGPTGWVDWEAPLPARRRGCEQRMRRAAVAAASPQV